MRGAGHTPASARASRADRRRSRPGIKKADPRPAILQIAPGVGARAELSAPPGPKFTSSSTSWPSSPSAFFAFFAFLAIVSSQGFNGLKRDTEACLAEGQPRNILDRQSQQIRGALPRAVMPLSSRYPQLLCVLMRFFAETQPRRPPFASRASCLTMSRTSTIFINSKPRCGLAGGSQGPLSGADAPCPARRRGSSWEKASRRKS
mgnify:CR=1 FL=1